MDPRGEPLECYTVGLGFVTSSNQYFPCGNGNSSSGVQSCCYAGDYCMSDNMCHYTHPVTNGTGYYMAGCTDRTWQDQNCPKQCTSEYGADVIYDTTNNRWNCCVSSEGVLDCQNPSNFTVEAPAPSELLIIRNLTETVPPVTTTAIGAIASLQASVTLSSIPAHSGGSSATAGVSSTTRSTTAAPSNTAASAATSQPSTPATTQLSAGASAGIAIACLLIAIAVAGMLGLWFFRRRRRRVSIDEPLSDAPEVWRPGQNTRAIAMKHQSTATAVELPMSPQEQQDLYRALREKSMASEMSAGTAAHEVEGTNSVHELSATNVPKSASSGKT